MHAPRAPRETAARCIALIPAAIRREPIAQVRDSIAIDNLNKFYPAETFSVRSLTINLEKKNETERNNRSLISIATLSNATAVRLRSNAQVDYLISAVIYSVVNKITRRFMRENAYYEAALAQPLSAISRIRGTCCEFLSALAASPWLGFLLPSHRTT